MKIEEYLDISREHLNDESMTLSGLKGIFFHLEAKLREAVEVAKLHPLEEDPDGYVRCPGCAQIEEVGFRMKHKPGCAAQRFLEGE